MEYFIFMLLEHHPASPHQKCTSNTSWEFVRPPPQPMESELTFEQPSSDAHGTSEIIGFWSRVSWWIHRGKEGTRLRVYFLTNIHVKIWWCNTSLTFRVPLPLFLLPMVKHDLKILSRRFQLYSILSREITSHAPFHGGQEDRTHSFVEHTHAV